MPPFASLTDRAAAPFLESRRTRNRVREVDRAELAAWYVAQVAGGDRNPAKTLSDRYPDSSYKTWANVFNRARTQQPTLLTDPPRRGVAGGVLTEHAERVLGYSSKVEGDIGNLYEEGRDVYSAPTRRERRTAMPRRSQFASEVEYDRAFDTWAGGAGVWHAEFESGEETHEDLEDWWNRMLQPSPG